MSLGMLTQEQKEMFDSIDRWKNQYIVWEAIKKIACDGNSTNQPKFYIGEIVLVNGSEFIVKDYCAVEGQFVYLLSIPANSIYCIIAGEDVISKKK